MWRESIRLLSFIVTVLLLSSGTYADSSSVTFQVRAQSGKILQANGDELTAVPASTVKLITALLALEQWGRDGRFETLFHWDPATATLGVTGSGDPFLVSEELRLIASALQQRGVDRVNHMVLDGSLFAPDLSVPGSSRTANPYDAIPSAIAANFNTINLRLVDNQYESAEPQTPLTPLALSVARSRPKEVGRMNTGFTQDGAEHYFAQLLGALLQEAGVSVTDRVSQGNVRTIPVLYTHQNTRTVGELVTSMLLYSNNFIASQLILTLSARHTSAPADFKQVKAYLDDEVIKRFGWQDASLIEGAGLSRDNRLSADHLVDVVDALTPWHDVLPQHNDVTLAKTGTLRGVSTLAGVIQRPNDAKQYFAILANGKHAGDSLAEQLRVLLTQAK